MANLYTLSDVLQQLDDSDFDLDDGEDSDFEGDGVHSYLPMARLDGIEDDDRDEDDNGDEDAHDDGDDEELDAPPAPLVRMTVIWTLPRVSLPF